MLNPRPRVSIGLPVYNGERFLRETLEAIAAQTFRDFELIISDNASMDGTHAICQEYAARDSRIRYYRNDQNLGATRNYNRVFELARGEYFKWAAHDDLFGPSFLEQCVQILDQHPSVVLCYAKSRVIDEHGRDLRDDPVDLNLRAPRPHQRYVAYHRRFRAHRNCNPVFGLIRAETLRQTPQIGNYVASDEVLLGELALRGEFYELPEFLFWRREHPNMSVKAYNIKHRLVWFDPARQDQLHLLVWRWLFEQVFAVHRVPMRWVEKLACYVELAKWMPRNWRKLYNEVILSAKHMFRPLPGVIKRPVKFVLHVAWRLVKFLYTAVRAGLALARRQAYRRS
jgi:glycosyltransferase involved in cell wall biosynthesis